MALRTFLSKNVTDSQVAPSTVFRTYTNYQDLHRKDATKIQLLQNQNHQYLNSSTTNVERDIQIEGSCLIQISNGFVVLAIDNEVEDFELWDY